MSHTESESSSPNFSEESKSTLGGKARRRLFTGNNDKTEQQKRHSLESIRAKRKRYRVKKKAKKKEAWETALIDSMRQRWKERRLLYEKEEEELSKKMNEGKCDQEEKNNECRCIEPSFQTEKGSNEEVFFDTQISSNSQLQDSNEHTTEMPFDTLVLPTVCIPDCKHESAQEISSKVPIAGLSSLDSVSTISFIQNIQDKTTNALGLAQYYRNIAEKMRKEKLEMKEVMNKKVESVRNFWRNCIMEKKTRAGRIVYNSLTNK